MKRKSTVRVMIYARDEKYLNWFSPLVGQIEIEVAINHMSREMNHKPKGKGFI